MSKRLLILFTALVAALGVTQMAHADSTRTSRFMHLNDVATGEYQKGAFAFQGFLCTKVALATSYEGEKLYTVPITVSTRQKCLDGEFASPLEQFGKRFAARVGSGDRVAIFLEMAPAEEQLDWSQGLPWNHGQKLREETAPVPAPKEEKAQADDSAPFPTYQTEDGKTTVPYQSVPGEGQKTGQAPVEDLPAVCVLAKKQENKYAAEQCRRELFELKKARERMELWNAENGGEYQSPAQLQLAINRCVSAVEDHNRGVDMCLRGGGGELAQIGREEVRGHCNKENNDLGYVLCRAASAEVGQKADEMVCGKHARTSTCHQDPSYRPGGGGLYGNIAGRL